MNAGKLRSATYIFWSRHVCMLIPPDVKNHSVPSLPKRWALESDPKSPDTFALHLWHMTIRLPLLAVPFCSQKSFLRQSNGFGGRREYWPTRCSADSFALAWRDCPECGWMHEDPIGMVWTGRGDQFVFWLELFSLELKLPKKNSDFPGTFEMLLKDFLVVLYSNSSGRLQLLMLGVERYRPVRHTSFINRSLLCCLLCSLQR